MPKEVGFGVRSQGYVIRCVSLWKTFRKRAPKCTAGRNVSTMRARNELTLNPCVLGQRIPAPHGGARNYFVSFCVAKYVNGSEERLE